ncbi:MAG: hypothetical protein AB1847_19220 [bacterium]
MHEDRLHSPVSLSGFPLAILGCAFLLSRVPYIFSGYGLDPDAYFVMLSARKILATVRYWMSRPPGYPLFEILCALLSPGGFLATNAMTVLISWLSVFPLREILRLLRVKNQGWLLVTFCFAPIVWIQSSCTMDYMWALFFILAACCLFFRRKYSLGGVALGIAVGFRLTSGLMILPLSLHLYFQERTVRKMLSPLFLFGLTCLLVYAPVFSSYGLSFLSYVPSKDPFYVWGYRTLSELLGFPAFLILAFGVFSLMFKIRRKEKVQQVDSDTLVLLLIVAGYSLLFLKLPAETAYLIPLIPFGLILLDRIFSRKLFILFCIFFLLNGVVSIAAVDKKAYRTNGQIRILPFDYGTVVKNEKRRRAVYQNAQKLLPVAESLAKDHKTAVIVEWYKPVFEFLHQSALEETTIDGRMPALKRRGKDLFFLESVTAGELAFLRERQFTLYYLDAVKRAAPSSPDEDLFTYARQMPGIDSYPVNY